MRDAKTEHYLDAGGYTYRYVAEYDLRRINLPSALHNPARLHQRLDDDRVFKMAEVMEQSTAAFPAIVVFEEVGPTDGLVTGAHRISAADLAGVKHFDAYLVRELDDYRRALLPRSINNLEGRSPNQAENLNQIAELIRLYPDASQADLAKAFGVKQPAISEHLRLIEYETRAAHGEVLDIWNRLPVGMRMRVGRITSDSTFALTVRALGETRLNGRAATDLIDAVRAKRTEAAAAALLGETVRHHVELALKTKVKFGMRQKQPVCTRWFGRVKTLWRFLPAWNVAALHFGAMPIAELETNISILTETIEQLEDALADLRARQDQREDTSLWRTNGGPNSAHTSPLT